MAAAPAALRRVRGHPGGRLFEDDQGAVPEAPGADPHAGQHRPEVPAGRRPRSPGSVRRARARASVATSATRPQPGGGASGVVRARTRRDLHRQTPACGRTQPLRPPRSKRPRLVNAQHRFAETSSCLPRPDPRAAPRPTKDCRPGRRPAPSRSPGLLRGARQPSGSPRCRHASARPDAADPSALRAAPVSAVPAVGAARRSGRRGCCHARWAPFPRPGACTGGSRLWLPDLRLAFQEGHLAAKTWWAQQDSNLWTPRL